MDHILDIIINYLGTLGVGGLLVAVFIEALGLPFPGGIMVIIAGVLAGQGKISLALVIGATVAGFTLGASTSFYLGKNVGEPVIERYGKSLHISREAFNRAQKWMQQSSAAFIVAGRFIPMISNLTPFMAGMSQLSWGKFLFYNSIFVLVWSGFHISLGLFFGHNWQHIATNIQGKIPLIATAVIIIYLGIRYLNINRRKKAPDVLR